MNTITSPAAFFGAEPGADRTMLHWNDIVSYLRKLESESGRIRVESMGLSTEGNEFIAVYVSSEKTMETLDAYRQISKKLADPRGLSDEEIARLSREGKAVCLQMMGLHSNEVGGTQCVPTLIYELVSGESEKMRAIRDETILVMIPCGNPDGEIDFYDWYYANINTPSEGSCSPHLRHKYAGHSNNRDGMHNHLIETKYITKLVCDWMPQVFLDQHHQSPDMDRLTICPYVNPMNPELSPMLVHEMEMYGGYLSCELTRAGVKGVVTGDEFYPDWMMYAPQDVVKFKNIAGILAESADASIATPVYMPIETLTAHKRAHVIPSMECPDPWQGGWWRLSDIVYQMKVTAEAALSCLAKNREDVLRNMAFKALSQTKRGENDRVKAFLIPRAQHDPSTLAHLIDILKRQEIEIFELCARYHEYPIGTFVIPTSQPFYALVKVLFSKTEYPVNSYTIQEDGSVHLFDNSSLNMAEFMGITVGEAEEAVAVRPITAPVVLPDTMPANVNDSYRRANALIHEGTRVFRADDGSFNTEGIGRAVSIPKIGLLKFSFTGNSEEGFCRLLLETHNFPYRIVMDREVCRGEIDDIDVFILPGDTDYRLMKDFGEGSYEQMQKFLARGGRLIAWGESCEYAVRLTGADLRNQIAGLPMKELDARGAALRARFAESDFTLGMQKECSVIYHNGPVYRAEDDPRCTSFASFPSGDLLRSGFLRGEEHLAGMSIASRIRTEAGEAVIYSFDPKYRMQTDATYKLLFNALYRYDN